MGWAARANRLKQRRDRFSPGDDGPVLDRVRLLAKDLDEPGLERLLATVPNVLKRAEMRKLMAPLVQKR